MVNRINIVLFLLLCVEAGGLAQQQCTLDVTSSEICSTCITPTEQTNKFSLNVSSDICDAETFIQCRNVCSYYIFAASNNNGGNIYSSLIFN